MNYRADIDGLRAIAVFSVVMLHAFGSVFPNGFLGVDVFFVISGFVITASLMSQKNLPLSDYLLRFYSRRFARLLPALFLVLMFTALAISLVNPFPHDHLITAIFAIFGLANVNLYFAEQDYFSYATSLNPFTHTWSLGVEEQFYLLIPVIIWFFLRKDRTGLARVILTVAAVISFVAWALVNETRESAAFYLLPFRFWELAAGVLASLLIHHAKNKEGILLGVLKNRQIGSFLAVLLGIVLFFPNEIPLLPATVVVILCTAGILLRDISGTLVGSLLTNKFMNAAGRSSYSIYLWHWPLIVLGLWTVGGGVLTNTVLVIASVILGYLSYRYVESPIRNGFTLKGAMAGGFWIVCMGCVSLLPVSIIWLFPSFYMGQEVKMETLGIQTLTTQIVSDEGGRWMGVECVLGSNADVGKVIDISRCTLGQSTSTVHRVLVAGDSYSASFVPAFAQLSAETDTAFTITSAWAASSIDTIVNTGPLPESNKYYWSEVVPPLIAGLKTGDTVLLISNFTDQMPVTMTEGIQQQLKALKLGLSSLSSRLSERDISLVVAGPLPFVFDAKCTPSMAAPQWFAPNGAPCLYYSRAETEHRQAKVRAILAELESANLLKVVNLDSVFCPTEACTHFGQGGVHLYRDVYAHPSGEAARMSAGLFREKLR